MERYNCHSLIFSHTDLIRKLSISLLCHQNCRSSNLSPLIGNAFRWRIHFINQWNDDFHTFWLHLGYIDVQFLFSVYAASYHSSDKFSCMTSTSGRLIFEEEKKLNSCREIIHHSKHLPKNRSHYFTQEWSTLFVSLKLPSLTQCL